MRLRVTHFGEEILREEGAPVTDFGPALRTLFADMVETMRAEDGIGLAAQQIGRALQFCVVDARIPGEEVPDFLCQLDGKSAPPLDLWMPLGMANPVVKNLPSDDYAYDEGCLSFPDLRGEVIRPGTIEARYQSLDGASHVLVCDGLLARVIQHEVDHLNGVLFIDRMEPRVRQRLDSRLKKLRRKTRDSQKK
jgi:peptide deformylase